jgi:hypothetical protein
MPREDIPHFLKLFTRIMYAARFVLLRSRRMKWARYVARVKERRGVYRVLVGKFKGKRVLARPRRGWEGSVKIYVKENVC